jgi:hypothetical protein
VRGDEDFFDAQALHALAKLLTIDAVAVAEEIGRSGVVRESVDDLLRGPPGRGLLGDVEVEDMAAVVGKDHEDEEDPQARRRDGEEVDRNQVVDVVGEECPPRLRRGAAPLREQARDGALGDSDAQLRRRSRLAKTCVTQTQFESCRVTTELAGINPRNKSGE